MTNYISEPPANYSDYDRRCARCGGRLDCWIHCVNCLEGLMAGERCKVCHGLGGFDLCIHSEIWCYQNPLPGREDVRRNDVEYVLLRGEKRRP